LLQHSTGSSPDGTKVWYQHGKLHRSDGPAVISPDGTEFWYQHGKLHRSDGPASIEPADDIQEWWENSKRIR